MNSGVGLRVLDLRRRFGDLDNDRDFDLGLTGDGDLRLGGDLDLDLDTLREADLLRLGDRDRIMLTVDNAHPSVVRVLVVGNCRQPYAGSVRSKERSAVLLLRAVRDWDRATPPHRNEPGCWAQPDSLTASRCLPPVLSLQVRCRRLPGQPPDIRFCF